MSASHTLTPADVANLRASVPHSTRTLGGFVRQPVAHLVYIASEDRFALLRDGHLLAQHANGAVLCALMRRERTEPGFINRVLSPTEDPERALDSPQTLQSREAVQRAAQARSAASREAAEAAEWQSRRLDILGSAITLDDLD